jgi:hypothetical protein
MHRDDRGPTSLQALDASLTAVRGAVAHDPEHPRCRSIGLLLHDLGDQATEGTQPGLAFAAAKDLLAGTESREGRKPKPAMVPRRRRAVV